MNVSVPYRMFCSRQRRKRRRQMTETFASYKQSPEEGGEEATQSRQNKWSRRKNQPPSLGVTWGAEEPSIRTRSTDSMRACSSQVYAHAQVRCATQYFSCMNALCPLARERTFAHLMTGMPSFVRLSSSTHRHSIHECA